MCAMRAARGIAGASTAIQRWTIVLLLFVLYSAALTFGGCQWGQARESKAREALAAQQARAEARARAEERSERRDLDVKLTEQAAGDNRASANRYRQLRQEVPHVVAPIVAPQAAPHVSQPPESTVPDLDDPVCTCGFSDDFVRVWNDALVAGLPGASELDARAPGTTDAAGDGQR